MMKIKDYFEIQNAVSSFLDNSDSRKNMHSLRKNAMVEKPIVKLAFDTRKIDQETEVNPRRGLQNYHRSEAFISEAMSNKLETLVKLKDILEELRKEYEKEPEWQDSYARILHSTLEKGLRLVQKDGDYTDSVPGIGSFDYIEELLYVRYRLTPEMIDSMSSTDIKKSILSKDEELTKKDKNKAHVEINKHEVGKENYDTLLEKLFGGVKATKDNKSVSRTVTITIKDDYLGEEQ